MQQTLEPLGLEDQERIKTVATASGAKANFMGVALGLACLGIASYCAVELYHDLSTGGITPEVALKLGGSIVSALLGASLISYLLYKAFQAYQADKELLKYGDYGPYLEQYQNSAQGNKTFC
jgi:hypothetical protein